MFSGRSKLNAMWTEFERGGNEESHTKSGSPKSASRGSFQSEKSAPASPQQPQADTATSLESTSQQAGRLFSNFSSFLSRKTKEFSQAMEVRKDKAW